MDSPGPDTSRPPPGAVLYLLAIIGGIAGTLAAVWEEAFHSHLVVVLILAPAVEEVCKPLGVIFLLETRAHWLRSRRQVLILSLLGAGAFATLENLVYIHFYHPHATVSFVVWRYAVCTALHLSATAIFAVGLTKLWRHIRDAGGTFDIDVCFKHYVAAVVVHAAYNGTVTILEKIGLLKF